MVIDSNSKLHYDEDKKYLESFEKIGSICRLSITLDDEVDLNLTDDLTDDLSADLTAVLTADLTDDLDELNNCSHNVSFLQSMVQDDEIPKKFLESITDKSIALSMKFSHRKHITQIINKFIKF